MKLAAKDGIEPSIENLAKLSDEYLALAPGMERTQFLMDRFGRSGDEMGKLLEKGRDFLEGSAFIINGLKESILWAFLLIAACMLYLFRSFKILLCSLIPNVIPLIVTAGVMGWVGVPIKPSTVLVFSVALGIAIDITIRFLINYQQELKRSDKSKQEIVIETIHKTGISIIYTSLVLIAGFIIFVFSGFGGTQALGWLTSLTLIMATLTNLVFLPALLILMVRDNKHPV